jgi:hypothetical protein
VSTRLVRIIIDPEKVAPGEYAIGGVRIVECGDDAALGRELRTKEVRVHSETEAARMREMIAESDFLEELVDAT